MPNSPTLEEYEAACKVIDDWSEENPAPKPDTVTELHGIIKALRYMLRTEQGQSVLERCATVMRRHDQMYAKLGNYGTSIKIEQVGSRTVVKSEDGQHG